MSPEHCAECGASINQAGRGRPRRFCGDACKHRATNRRQRRSQTPMRTREQRNCVHCGRLFEAVRRNHVACSRSCSSALSEVRQKAGVAGPRAVRCGECQTEFISKTHRAQWCSKACANRHYGRLRARQRGPAAAVPYTDLEIFQRDGWRCHLCRTRVRRDVPRLHPDGATIDHLIPLSVGGLDEPANVATAHWRCNNKKRARAANDQLALF